MVGVSPAESPALTPSTSQSGFVSSFLEISPPLSSPSEEEWNACLQFLFTYNWISAKDEFPQKAVYLPKDINSIVAINYANPKSYSQHVALFFF